MGATYICDKCGLIMYRTESRLPSENHCVRFGCEGEFNVLDELCVHRIRQLQAKGYDTHFCCSGHPDVGKRTQCYYVVSVKKPFVNKNFLKAIKQWKEKYKGVFDYGRYKIELNNDIRKCMKELDETSYYIGVSLSYSNSEDRIADLDRWLDANKIFDDIVGNMPNLLN